MDQADLEKTLQGLPLVKLAYFDRVGSTNDVAVEWARQGVGSPSLAVADEQTRGRGRSGRRWLTPPGSALAFTLLLESGPVANHSIGRATGLGALGVCEALEREFALKPEIKWPNDILLEGKKACGVLAEAHWTGERLGALVLGIGINIAAPSVPPSAGLNFPATCLETVAGREISRIALLKAVLERILAWQPRLQQPDFITAWESRLAYRGQTVDVEIRPGQHIQAELLGLAEEGQLKLRLPSGATRVFAVGEIRLPPHVDSQAA